MIRDSGDIETDEEESDNKSMPSLEDVGDEDDVIPPEAVLPTTRWGADPIRMKTGPITRAQAKRFKDNLATFIQGII